ncbi:hypothetical protein BH20VER2_BH20VER2_17700 [soil metagenome]
MIIQINTDNHIEGREALAEEAEASVQSALEHFTGQITRVEVHLGDENSHKGGQNDKRCAMEARLEGRRPVAVTHHAGTIEDAIDGAAGKLKRAIESTIGRLSNH